MLEPVLLRETVEAPAGARLLAARFTHPLLLAPMAGAFFDLMYSRRVPSILWPVLLLGSAIGSRALKTRAVPRDRDVLVGADGILIEDTFLAACDLKNVELVGDTIVITARSDYRFVLEGDFERASPVALMLEAAIRSPADGDAAVLAASSLNESAYREHAVDTDRCLAVTEDYTAPAGVRIAAARLLAQVPELRPRIEEIAAGTANPALRAALLHR